jgi:hypothetical protein
MLFYSDAFWPIKRPFSGSNYWCVLTSIWFNWKCCTNYMFSKHGTINIKIMNTAPSNVIKPDGSENTPVITPRRWPLARLKCVRIKNIVHVSWRFCTNYMATYGCVMVGKMPLGVRSIHTCILYC